MVECELRRTQLFIARGVSFNRYMVECESVYHMSTFVDNKVLIDTWWNVNVAIAILVIWYLSF